MGNYINAKEVKLDDIFERNDPCICGSEKKFKKCCIGKTMIEGIYNYQNRRIIYDKDKEIEHTANLLYIINNEIKGNKPLLIEDGFEILRVIYGEADSLVSQYEQYYSCKKGCSLCCNVYVDVTPLEAEWIRHYIKDCVDTATRKILLDKIIDNAKCSPSSFKNMSLAEADRIGFEYFKKGIHCPFLSSEGYCLIYDVRPFNCRTYNVISDPIECRPGGDNIFFNKDIYNDVLRNLPHLSKRISTTLNHDNNLTTRHISHWFKEGFNESVFSTMG